MSALPVVLTTGEITVEGRAAVPVYVDANVPPGAGPARNVILVPDNHPRAGGPPAAVVSMTGVLPGVGPALPVYVVSGYLGPTFYGARLLDINPGALIAYWPLSEAAGPTADDLSSQNNDGTYAAAGITYGVPGIGDGRTGIRLNGNDTNVQIGSAGFAADWNGDKGSAIVWAKANDASVWSDVSTHRWWLHVRSSSDINYYIVMGKANTAAQTLEWRRRSGGLIQLITKTYAPTAPVGEWIAMGLTWDVAGSGLVKAYLNGVFQGQSNNGISSWTAASPSGGASVLFAGSTTLQEWIGDGAQAAVWNAVLSDAQMQQAMTLPI